MFYRSYTPQQPLGDFVERLWLCSDAPPHSRERILPSGTIELVVNLREDEIRIYDPSHPDRCTRMSGATVSGPYSRFFVIDPLQHASILGVHCRPGGAFPFLGVPAGELADTHVQFFPIPIPPAGRRMGREEVGYVEATRFGTVLGRIADGEQRGQRPAAVRYQVKDVDRAVAFYTQHLGFKVEQRPGPAFASVSNGNLTLWLSGPESSGSRPMPDGRRQEPGGWNRLVLQVDDLASRAAELKKAGLRFRNEIETGPGGKQIQVEDPDGNPVELFEPASTPNGRTGS